MKITSLPLAGKFSATAALAACLLATLTSPTNAADRGGDPRGGEFRRGPSSGGAPSRPAPSMSRPSAPSRPSPSYTPRSAPPSRPSPSYTPRSAPPSRPSPSYSPRPSESPRPAYVTPSRPSSPRFTPPSRPSSPGIVTRDRSDFTPRTREPRDVRTPDLPRRPSLPDGVRPSSPRGDRPDYTPGISRGPRADGPSGISRGPRPAGSPGFASRENRHFHDSSRFSRPDRSLVYSSYPHRHYRLCYGDGFRGLGWYFGPPGFSYYYQAPSVVYYSSREYIPQDYLSLSDSPASSLDYAVQQALYNLGYYEGPIDGDIGPGTRLAIANFQADNGLEPTGIIDETLVAYLQIE